MTIPSLLPSTEPSVLPPDAPSLLPPDDPGGGVTTLSLIKANLWRAGYEIQDLAGNTTFVVASEGLVGFQKYSGAPIFAAVICAPGTTVITAVVVRDQGFVFDCFEIYTITANYDGQNETSERRASLAAPGNPLYLCSKLSISFMGGTLTYSRCQSENESDVVTLNAKLLPMMPIIVLTCALGAFCCAPREIKMYEPGQRKKNVPAILCRKKGIVEVAEGFPLFEAVCIAYALDRETTISSEECIASMGWIKR